MTDRTILVFFLVFAVIVTVFVLVVRIQGRKRKNRNENELYGGEDGVDAFFKRIENL